MSSKNTNYGITLNGLVDLSQARKDIEAFTAKEKNREHRKIVLNVETNIDAASKKLEEAIDKHLIKKVDEGMKRVSTSIKTGLSGSIDGKEFKNLTKIVETFQNDLGKIQERVSYFTEEADKRIRPLTNSVTTLKEGIQSINTTTENSIEIINGFYGKISKVTEEITDTNNKTHTVITTTKEWVNKQGELNQQIEKTDKKGNKLAATITNISNDTKKASKLMDELAGSLSKVQQQVPKNNKTSTITYVDKNGVKTVTQLINGIKTLTTTTREYTSTQGALVKETKELNLVTGDTKVHTEVIKNKQDEIQKSKELQTQLAREREERKRLNDALVSTTTTTSRGKTQQFGDDSGRYYEALITRIERVDEANRKVIQTTYEFTNAQGQLVRQTRTTDAEERKLAEDTIEISNANERASESNRRLANSTREVTTAQNTMGGALSRALTTLTQYYLASLPIRAVRTAIQETITTLKDFDSALIEFRKVSDLAGESLTNYVAKLAEMGEITGSTMQAMVEAATEFRKSGFSDEDSAKLASIAEKYRNIADEEISAGESASFIIAQMKAFNIEADQAEHIIDAVLISNI